MPVLGTLDVTLGGLSLLRSANTTLLRTGGAEAAVDFDAAASAALEADVRGDARVLRAA